MSGTKEGSKKAKKTILERYGEDHFKEMGRKGGKVKTAKGFALNKKLAKEAGAKGGKISRRGPSVKPVKTEFIDIDQEF